MTFNDARLAGVLRRRRVDLLASLPAAVAAGVFVLLLANGASLLHDPDTYWNVVLGDWIIAHAQVPHTDVFSFTMAGKHWISSEWLSQVLYASARRLAGWSGVVLLAASAIALAFGLLVRFLAARLAWAPTLILAVMAFIVTAPHMLARPHVLALPVMVAWTAGLVGALDGRRPPPYALLPLMTLWANLHGGFTFGIALLAPVTLEALWLAPASQRAAVLGRWALFGALAVIAACLTPYGPESILVTGRILGLGPALATVGEWQPQSFASLTGFELCLLVGIGAALYRGVSLPPIRIAVVLGLLCMALSHVRSGELLALLAPLFMAAPLAAQVGAREAGGIGRPLPTFALMLVLAGLGAAVAAASPYRPADAITPAGAVAAVKASGARRVLNSYDFGGYLIASGIRPFVDGRTELYGSKFILRDADAIDLRDVGGFLDLLRRYDIDATLLAPNTAANGLLARLKGWKRIYGDDIATVYVRTGPADDGPSIETESGMLP